MTLECLAIGSLPQKNIDDAMQLVKENFADIPFWPQLVKISKNEDMLVQFLENMPSFSYEGDKNFFDSESEEFYEGLEQFFSDYEKIIEDINCEEIERYAIKSSIAFEKFLDFVKETKPRYAKGQVVGAFTLAGYLTDRSGKAALFDETLRDIIVKTLTIKALWQVYKIKKASENTVPIIFIDEPSISQLGTSAYITISKDDAVEMIKSVSDAVKKFGGISAVHCCGKCDWTVPVRAGVNIINMDAYGYAKNLSLFGADVEEFLKSGGKIAWGIIPTLNADALACADVEEMVCVFDKAVKYLTKKGIDEKIIIENSLITPSCGAGALSESLAEKAMKLTKQLSESLKERYYDI